MIALIALLLVPAQDLPAMGKPTTGHGGTPVTVIQSGVMILNNNIPVLLNNSIPLVLE